MKLKDKHAIHRIINESSDILYFGTDGHSLPPNSFCLACNCGWKGESWMIGKYRGSSEGFEMKIERVLHLLGELDV